MGEAMRDESTDNPTIAGTGGEIIEFPAASGDTFPVHPDYEFEIGERQLVSGVLDVTDSQRLRVAARALSETDPRLERLASGNERKRIFEARTDYIRRYRKQFRFTSGEGESAVTTTMSARDIVADVTRNDVPRLLRDTNHPTAQLIEHIRDTVGHKLTDNQLDHLSEDLITLSAWPLIKQAAEQRIAEAD